VLDALVVITALNVIRVGRDAAVPPANQVKENSISARC
jgi:hypothetical protein